ncbi:MAG TPA: outer membrane beta-barrel protein [Blastocatellia bacterium]|jgi:hypothetical protein|nr:outer membrane beta-barrel protein [Blastocatellia bacterium]
MPKETLLAVVASLLLVCSAQAQDQKKFEAGMQFSMLREGNGVFNFGPTQILANPRVDRTPLGFGGRIGYNINRFWSLEVEANVFPEQNRLDLGDIVCCANGTVIDGRIVEGLAGTKIGLRKGKLGIYGRLRPGFLHFSRSLGDCTPIPGIGPQCSFDKGRTDFALDVGGTVELHISERWFMRSDVGDIIQRFSGLPGDRQRLPFLLSDTSSQLYHNFQFTTGVGYRF